MRRRRSVATGAGAGAAGSARRRTAARDGARRSGRRARSAADRSVRARRRRSAACCCCTICIRRISRRACAGRGTALPGPCAGRTSRSSSSTVDEQGAVRVRAASGAKGCGSAGPDVAARDRERHLRSRAGSDRRRRRRAARTGGRRVRAARLRCGRRVHSAQAVHSTMDRGSPDRARRRPRDAAALRPSETTRPSGASSAAPCSPAIIVIWSNPPGTSWSAPATPAPFCSAIRRMPTYKRRAARVARIDPISAERCAVGRAEHSDRPGVLLPQLARQAR